VLNNVDDDGELWICKDLEGESLDLFKNTSKCG
jgi:hypothetical protein